MRKTHQVVLDDALYKEYNAYKSSNPQNIIPYSQDKISRILKFSGGDILTNNAQYDRVIDKKDKNRQTALLNDPNRKKSLEDLAKDTTYKIILTDDKDKKKYPYVNINDDEIDMVLGGFIMRGKSRAKAIEHIKNLCADARSVVIYDNFFSGNSAKTKNNVKILTDILPKNRKLEVIYHKDPNNQPHFSEECIKLIKSVAPNWIILDRILPDHHDRYIIINETIQIILTSGFDHINNSNKEFSYIVRKYDKRFGDTMADARIAPFS